MDFGWTPQQDELFARTLEFARATLAPASRDPDEQDRFDPDRWRALAEFGVLGLCLPERLGGLGLDALTSARVLEAAGQGCSDLGLLFSAAAHVFACAVPILELGSPALVEELVPRLARGELIGANAMTEPGSGSDTTSLATRARLDGDDYLISGDKCYVTNGPIADLFLVYATTNPAHGYLGTTAFVVRRDQPGVSVGPAMAKVGLRSSPLGSLYLDEVRVPRSHRIGSEGGGAKLFQASMAWERACLFGIYVGAMQRQLDGVIAYAHERKQSGKRIGKFQAVSHRIADMKLRLEGARLLLYRACWAHDHGEDASQWIALSKLAVSEAAVQSGQDAIQLHGGLGIMTEAGIERGLRDALASTIVSGTSEIQRNMIARGLGL